jgi:23S rRNA (guanosine2251-2'-O)-methyltransferase
MISKKSMSELDRKSPEEVKESSKNRILLVLDDVRSMHNVGSAFRTADAFAVEGIFLAGFTPSPPHRDIHKTALGATETVKWRHFPTTAEAIAAAREAGFSVYAVEQVHQRILLNEMNWEGNPLALVFGNEVTGVSEEVLSLVDGAIEIPQWGAKHSLNVSVSIGVVLWEFVRGTPAG